MKFVKIIKPYQNQNYKAGQIVKVSDSVAEQLIKAKSAEAVTVKPAKLKDSKLPEKFPFKSQLSAYGLVTVDNVKDFKSAGKGSKSLLHTIPGIGNEGEFEITRFIGKMEAEAKKAK